jgi:site-specific DNA-methyltransferase (adenine-specific)
MRPYYEHAGITIYHGDCREVARSLPPFGCSACIADPPYGDTSLDWDKQPARGWMSEIEPALAVSGSLWVFGSFRYFFENATEFQAWKLAQEIVWEKHNGSSFHADRFKRVHELAVQFYRGDWAAIHKAPVTTPDATARTVRRKQRPPHTGHIEAGSYWSEDGGPRLMRSVIYARSCHGIAEHPTQKPLSIIDPLLRYSVPVSGSVFDAFMGSGSVLVAAKRLGLSAVGADTDEAYCETAARRLSQEVFDFSEATA